MLQRNLLRSSSNEVAVVVSGKIRNLVPEPHRRLPRSSCQEASHSLAALHFYVTRASVYPVLAGQQGVPWDELVVATQGCPAV